MAAWHSSTFGCTSGGNALARAFDFRPGAKSDIDSIDFDVGIRERMPESSESAFFERIVGIVALERENGLFCFQQDGNQHIGDVDRISHIEHRAGIDMNGEQIGAVFIFQSLRQLFQLRRLARAWQSGKQFKNGFVG